MGIFTFIKYFRKDWSCIWSGI